jgi:hypothetical protein
MGQTHLANLSAIKDQLRIASYRKNLQQEQVERQKKRPMGDKTASGHYIKKKTSRRQKTPKPLPHTYTAAL